MHFYVKDHLGSNRLVVDGNGNIEEVNHYYPFGALMGDRCGVSRNNYKYIGKELDTMYGWNMQDHEARCMIRWWVGGWLQTLCRRNMQVLVVIVIRITIQLFITIQMERMLF